MKYQNDGKRMKPVRHSGGSIVTMRLLIEEIQPNAADWSVQMTQSVLQKQPKSFLR